MNNPDYLARSFGAAALAAVNGQHGGTLMTGFWSIVAFVYFVKYALLYWKGTIT